MLKALDLHYALQRNAMFCSYIKIINRGLYLSEYGKCTEFSERVNSIFSNAFTKIHPSIIVNLYKRVMSRATPY